jgi:hypothetical protein
MVGWALLASLVRSMVIEMLKVLAEHCGGVTFAVDQNPVGALCPDAAHESLGEQLARGVRGGVLTVSMPSLAKTASKDVVNLVSRSRMRDRNSVVRWSRSAMRLRAAWVVQVAVGWAVTPSRWARRVRTSITNST